MLFRSREEDSGENTGRENRNQEAGVTGNRKEENVSLEPDSLETDIQRNTSLREEKEAEDGTGRR